MSGVFERFVVKAGFGSRYGELARFVFVRKREFSGGVRGLVALYVCRSKSGLRSEVVVEFDFFGKGSNAAFGNERVRFVFRR